MSSAELYGIVHDHLISGSRVAATSVIAARYMARPDSKVLGVFGSGYQARSHIVAHVEAFASIDRVLICSPSPERSGRVAAELNKQLRAECVAVDYPESIMRESDIVIAATNSVDPVVHGSLLRAGQHITTIASPDRYFPRTEIDEEVLTRADRVVVNSITQVEDDNQLNMLTYLADSCVQRQPVLELPTVVSGKKSIREFDNEVTVYDNNVGMGVQFAVAGAMIVERAINSELGTFLPRSLFVSERLSDDGDAAP